LAPVWVGILSYFFLKNKPAVNFWFGTLVAILGMVTLVGFTFFIQLKFDLAFSLALLSGILYAVYIIVSKNVLSEVDVNSFMTITLVASTLFLGVVNYCAGEAFFGFSNNAWWVLFIQGAVCQLIAWLLISYATQNMRATRVSLSLLSQGVITTFLAWLFIDEQVTLQMILGGIMLLFGISITFIENKKV
jgi:drug/metabolite transporter (DMT)-like permease